MNHKDNIVFVRGLRSTTKTLKDVDRRQGPLSSHTAMDAWRSFCKQCHEIDSIMKPAAAITVDNSRTRSMWWQQWSAGQTSKEFINCFDQALSCVPHLPLSNPDVVTLAAAALIAANCVLEHVCSGDGCSYPETWPQVEFWLRQQGMARNISAFAKLLRLVLLGTARCDEGALILNGQLNSLFRNLYFFSMRNSRVGSAFLGVSADDVMDLYCTSLQFLIPHLRKWLEADSNTRPSVDDATQAPRLWLFHLASLNQICLVPSLSSADWRPLMPLLVQSFQLARDFHAKALPEDPTWAEWIFDLGLSFPLAIMAPLLRKSCGGTIQVWPCRCALQAMQIALLPGSRLLALPWLKAAASTASLPSSSSKEEHKLSVHAGDVLSTFSPELLKPQQLWDLMCLMEETLRLTAPYLTPDALPHVACLWEAMGKASHAIVDLGAGLSGHNIAQPSPCLPEQLCSSLLRLVSMGLTMVKAVALLPVKLDSTGCHFFRDVLIFACLCCECPQSAGQTWVLPMRMRALDGMAALVVPAWCSLLSRVLPTATLEFGIAAAPSSGTTTPVSSTGTASSGTAPASGTLAPVSGRAVPTCDASDVAGTAVLQSSTAPSLPVPLEKSGQVIRATVACFRQIRRLCGGVSAPPLCLSVLLTDPLWTSIHSTSWVLHQAWQLSPQAASPGGEPTPAEAAAHGGRDCLAVEVAAIMALLVDSLACTALGEQPFRSAQQHQQAGSNQLWAAAASQCCALLGSSLLAEEIDSLARFRYMAAEMRGHPDERASSVPEPCSSSAAELSEAAGSSEAVLLAALSKVLGSEVWEVLLGCMSEVLPMAVVVSTCFHQLLIVLKQLLHSPGLDALFAEAGAMVSDLTGCLPSPGSADEIQGQGFGSASEESPFDMMEAGHSLLRLLRKILLLGQSAMQVGASAAPSALAPPQLGGSGVADGSSWELVRAELLLGLPEDLWGTGPCCSPACLQMGGPCEMTVKTLACAGGCGARYCCQACQVQAWSDGHMKNCSAMKVMRDRWQARQQPLVAGASKRVGAGM